jgi:hypothetical protein
MDEYLEKSKSFRFVTFLDYFNNVLYKDLEEIRKNIQNIINILETKKKDKKQTIQTKIKINKKNLKI